MLPNLIVIGAARAGTTSLHHHLGLHPEIAMSAPKELRFFLDRYNWSRGPEWYSAHFPDDAPVRGEATPRYASYPFAPDVPDRMAALIPDARLVYLVRDPVERIFSEYEMKVHDGRDRPLAELVDDLDGSYLVARSRYHFQLERFRRHYPDDRILVLDSAGLDRDTRATMARFFRFAGVDDTFTSPAFGRRLNGARKPPRVVGVGRRRGSPELTSRQRARLEDYLRPDAARLREHTGLPLASWSV